MRPCTQLRMPGPTLIGLLLFQISVASASQSRGEGKSPLVMGVAMVGMTVADMDRSVDFYSKVLSFKKISESYQESNEYRELENVPGAKARIVLLCLGNSDIELTQYVSPSGRPIPPDSRSNDLWFQHLAIVVSDMDKAYDSLRERGVHGISNRPQKLPKWNKLAADIEAFYFMDPDGHPLELIHFPKGKGDPRWQRKTAKLFLGIDHTAIATSNTEASLRFYHLFGFQERGHGLNYGIEQERLSNVAEARVRITSLRAHSGPGIELLEYQNPTTGRSAPADEHANDLVHHQTMLLTRDLHRTISKLCASRVIFVSVGASCDSPTRWESRHRVLVRDPDGHVMELVEQ